MLSFIHCDTEMAITAHTLHPIYQRVILTYKRQITKNIGPRYLASALSKSAVRCEDYIL